MWNLQQNFDAASVDAQIVIPTYHNPFSGDPTHEAAAQRTKIVVDSLGRDVGHVTKKYSLIRNPEVRFAVELLSEQQGLKFAGWKSQYRNGRTCLVWRDNTNPIRVTGDSSVLHPMCRLTNSYTGSHPLKLDFVICRHICENALIWGATTEIEVAQKHVGQIDLTELLTPAIVKLADAVAVAQLQMETLHQTKLPSSSPVWEDVKEDTAERYHEPLGRAIRENSRELGWTAYSALQAISEIGSNTMRGWAAADWTQRQTKRVLETDEVQAADIPALVA